LERTLIAPNVHLSYDPAEKFNRCRISVHFLFPARRETATAHALLPLVMERGYADCPDMTRLTKKLAQLYGADLTVDGRPQGCNHNLCVSVTGIKDKFALSGEELAKEYARMVLGVAFHPYLVDGVFDAEAVGIEKKMLKKALEDEVNDKRVYCMRQASREFFGSSPAGIRQEGYLEEVDDMTPQALTAAYREMLRTASIELIVLGCDRAQTQAVQQALLAELAQLPGGRDPEPLNGFVAMPRREVLRAREEFDMVQAKLCMVFTLGHTVTVSQLAAYRLAMALFGGSVTSRLFLNVREKMNLCYYCSSSFQSFTGSMVVNSGIEPSNAEKAEQAILKELADLCGGPISDEELEDCRRGLLCGLQGVEDTLGGLEAWYYMEVLRGGLIDTPAQAQEALCSVTKDDVRAVLNQFSLSVSYLLTKKEEGNADA
jgi:predicted Zn-dependent peptidase